MPMRTIHPLDSLHQARLGPEIIAGASLISSSQVLLDAATRLKIPPIRHEHKEDIGLYVFHVQPHAFLIKRTNPLAALTAILYLKQRDPVPQLPGALG